MTDLTPDARNVNTKVPHPPRLVPGGVYSVADVQHNLDISYETFQLWKQAGLRVRENLHTKSHVVLADDVIAFIASVETVQPRKKYKSRDTSRKRRK
jgi:hypothetical protein